MKEYKEEAGGKEMVYELGDSVWGAAEEGTGLECRKGIGQQDSFIMHSSLSATESYN